MKIQISRSDDGARCSGIKSALNNPHQDRSIRVHRRLGRLDSLFEMGLHRIADSDGDPQATRLRCTVIALASYVQRFLLATRAIDAAQRARPEVKNQQFSHVHMPVIAMFLPKPIELFCEVVLRTPPRSRTDDGY